MEIRGWEEVIDLAGWYYETGEADARRLHNLIDFLAISPISVKEGFFGSLYIGLFGMCKAISFLYESGAVLGRAKSDELTLLVLERMLTIRGHVEGAITKTAKQLAKERLERFKNDIGREPNTFNELILKRELEKAIGLSLCDDFKSYANVPRNTIKILDKKISRKQAEVHIQMFGLEGIGFGSSFPELTEKMIKNYYESIDIDMEVWDRVRAGGLFTPWRRPTVLSPEEQESAILEMVAGYAEGYHPELLGPLCLSDYKDKYWPRNSMGPRYSDWSYTAKELRSGLFCPELWLFSIDYVHETLSKKELSEQYKELIHRVRTKKKDKL